MRKLTIVNRTEDSLSISLAHKQQDVLLPSESTPVTLSLEKLGFDFTICATCGQNDMAKKEWALPAESFAVRLPMTLAAAWKVIRVPERCPWLIYRFRVARRHHSLLILPRRNLSSFLAEMPDTVALSSLLLPGTHDTMAFYGWPISQCQSLATPLPVQLRCGIRVLDVRLSVISSRLIAYHGLYPQRASFQEILADIHAFLTSPAGARETIIMSIKQEDFMTTSQALFSRLVREEIEAGAGGREMWFLENRIPHLGEVRGKVVMFSRFGGDGEEWEGGLEGLGIHPTVWPDSARSGFTWQCKDTLVRTHDWYNIPSFLSIPEKTQLAVEVLTPPANTSFPTLAITFFSASSFPLAFPPTIARGFGWPKLGFGIEGVNSRVGSWLLGMISGQRSEGVVESDLPRNKGEDDVRIRGWTLMDFFRDPESNAIVPLLVECNYRGRRAGEEGWP